MQVARVARGTFADVRDDRVTDRTWSFPTLRACEPSVTPPRCSASAASIDSLLPIAVELCLEPLSLPLDPHTRASLGIPAMRVSDVPSCAGAARFAR